MTNFVSSRRRHNNAKAILLIIIVAILIAVVVYFVNTIKRNTVKTAEDFNISQIKSSIDFNSNGVDDYTDILLGARKDAENMPTYDGKYCDGGYPPDNIGVCTDLVWRAFKNAGYDLKDMVDADIKENPKNYTNIQKADPNIDFRRVKNLKVFFESKAIKLTDDKNDISKWQAGDIVVFGNASHIGIISDKRDGNGIAYVIHNNGQLTCREEDFMISNNPTGHYRFDASKIEKSKLIAWHD